MADKTTIVVLPGYTYAALVRLVASIDAQAVAYDSFDVVFLVPAEDGDTADRLEPLARRRPNVAVHRIDGTVDDALRQVAESASGGWILPLSPAHQGADALLLPESIDRLRAYGTAHGCELVVARTGGAAAPAALLEDAAQVDLAALDGAPVLVLYARDPFLAHGLAVGPDAAQRWSEATDKFGVLGSYPGLAPSPSAAGTVLTSAYAASGGWESGVLEVTVEANGEAPPARLSLFDPAGYVEYWLDLTPAEGTAVRTRVDVRTAALGQPLPAGGWQLRAWTATGAELTPGVLPAGDLGPAVVGGHTLVAPLREALGFGLDIGATQHSVVGPLASDIVTLVESHRGTLLTADLPRLAADQPVDLAGGLLLGSFRLPARLVGDRSGVRLECFVTGLAGTNALSTQFGSGRPTATGLSLEIAGNGTMSVAPTPTPAPKPSAASSTPTTTNAAPAKKAPAKKAPAKKPPAKKTAPPPNQSLVGRLRRQIPAPLEPAVRQLAHNKVAKRIYRTLSGRP